MSQASVSASASGRATRVVYDSGSFAIEQLARAAGAEELLRAIQSRILKIHMLGTTTARGKPSIKLDDLAKQNSSNDRTLVEFIDFVARAVASGKTYPLFDALTGDFIYHAIREERLTVSDVNVARGKHSLLAGNLLERLPLFDNATVDEILDIRAELDQPLVRFRQAIIGFSEQMKHTAWEKDFQAEADQLFHKSVAPAVLEIEEKVRSTESLVSFLERLAKKPLLVSSGVLSVVLSQVSLVPELASIALTGGLASAAATSIIEYRELLKERQVIEQNQLYFYYRAGKLLAQG